MIKHHNDSSIYYFTKQYGSTVSVGIALDVSHATKNVAFKNYPRDISHNKNHFNTIVLVHVT